MNAARVYWKTGLVGLHAGCKEYVITGYTRKGMIFLSL